MRRAKTPTIIQMENAECGAAALSIILSYYHKYIPLEELRYRSGVSRDGCNAFNLVEAAKFYGLEAEGYRLNSEELSQLKPPLILHWQNNHFVVLEGMSKQWAYINDPATGPRKITRDDFNKNFSEIALNLKPSADFQKGDSQPTFYALIKDRLKQVSLVVFAVLLALQICVILIGLLPPAFSRVFLDNFLIKHLWDWKWPFLGLMVAGLILQAWSGIWGYISLRLQRQFTNHFSKEFLDHLLKLPILFFVQRYGAEIISRINVSNTISNLLTGHLASTVINIFLIGIYGAVIFRYDPLIATVGILAALLNLSMFVLVSRSRSDRYNRLKQEAAKGLGVAVDTLQNMESIKMMGLDSYSFGRVVGYQTLNLNNYQAISKKDAWLISCASFVNSLANIGLLGLSCWRVMEGHLTIGMLLALQMLMSTFLAPINQLLLFGMQIQTLKIDLMRLNDVMTNPTDTQILAPGDDSKLKGNLEVKNISFGYNPLDEPLIDQLNLVIKSGENLAVVGHTGSGKSTLTKLIAGIFKPWKGIIKYDGIPYQNLSENQLRNTLGWVDQDIFLFSGTIRENLCLWNNTISEEDLIKAVQDACIYEDILAKPGGFDFVLDEGASNLSQGQKQRLELARALVLNPSILLLDEATRFLDSETEQKILKNISKRHVTCIFSTHRLSTVKHCDRIIVMERGKIIQMGTHEELKEIPGAYQKLVNSFTLGSPQ